MNNNQPKNLAPGKDEDTVVVTAAANVPPGTYNLVLRAQAQVPFNKDAKAAQKPATQVVQASTPVSLTVLPAQVATLAVNNANPSLKAGAKTEVLVKVNRQHGYAGEFKVQLVLPAEAQGVIAEAVTIPAGQNEAKLVLEAPPSAQPGNRPNLTVRAVAVLEGGVALNHDTKINVNLVM